MFARKIDAKTTPIEAVYNDWERVWLSAETIKRFLAISGLTAPPYNLRVEDFLKFPHLRGMAARRFVRKLRQFGVTWSWNDGVVRRGVLQAVGYKLREIEEFEHNCIFGRKEVSVNV